MSKNSRDPVPDHSTLPQRSDPHSVTVRRARPVNRRAPAGAWDEPLLEFPREAVRRVMEEIDRAMESWRRLHARGWPED